MNRLAVILMTGALACAPVVVSAQQEPAPILPGGPAAGGVSSVPYRILDQDRLLRGSALGQEIMRGIRAREAELAAENQVYFDQLASEERDLTEARASLSPEEFRARADAFDARVEEIRAERAQASQELSRWSESEAQRFFDMALPVLVQLMNEEGILALFRPDTLILGSDFLDVTDAAIARLDAAHSGDGADAPANPATDATQDAAPDEGAPDEAGPEEGTPEEAAPGGE